MEALRFIRNKQTIKAQACNIVYLLIQQYLDSGQPFESAFNAGIPLDKAAPLAEALEEIKNEMDRRSDRWHKYLDACPEENPSHS